ncbi:MAG TPA: PrsW family intramembrane metalloprotease, partial [Thermoplasmata archaeon]|nr:PrsW family intramembrane metalloprotease [Thermoplasmata archaeon]
RGILLVSGPTRTAQVRRMTDLSPIEDLIVLFLAALVPALIYLAWVRGSEQSGPEPWGPLLSAFAFGALFATFVAAILESIIVAGGAAIGQYYPSPEFTFLNPSSQLSLFFLVLVVAPFIEEALKAGGVARHSDAIRRLADGPVVGASVGLGFGFFETFLYGLGAFLAGGLVAGLGLIIVRSLSSVLLHGSSTAMFGYGYAKGRFNFGGAEGGSYYGLAVLMHASFNALASLGSIAIALGYHGTVGNYADALGLVLAIVFAIAAINHVVTVIHESAFPSAGGSTSRYRPPTIPRRPPAGAVPGRR